MPYPLGAKCISMFLYVSINGIINKECNEVYLWKDILMLEVARTSLKMLGKDLFAQLTKQ